MTYLIEPEVPGQLGERTTLDTSTHPPVVKNLHFVVYGWLGDDLIESFPVFLITENLKSGLDAVNLSGYRINNCEIEISEEFKLLQPDTVLPELYWLEIIGENKDDFKIYKSKLTVSDSAYSVLSQFNLKNAIIEISEDK